MEAGWPHLCVPRTVPWRGWAHSHHRSTSTLIQDAHAHVAGHTDQQRQKYTYTGGSNGLILSCSLASLGSSRSGKCTHTHHLGASIRGVGLSACLAAAPGPQSVQALAPLASCGCGPTPGPFGTTPWLSLKKTPGRHFCSLSVLREGLHKRWGKTF